jgi:diguanylate cyclase (GGDEF)-like protein
MRGTPARSATGLLDAPPGTRAPFDPRAILTSIGEVVYDWDLASDTIAWGANACDVLGIRDMAGLSSGAAFALRVEPGSGLTRHEAILQTDASDGGSGVPYATRYMMRLRDSLPLWIEDTGRWFADAAGRPAFAHGVLRIDRSGRQHGADALGVGARERASFLERIKADVVEAGRSKQSISLLVLAINELGRLNDDLGCEGTDAIITEVAERIGTVMRRRDRLTRYAGNRFALALRSCPPDQVEAAAARVRQVIEAKPVPTGLGALGVRVSIGAATAPKHALDAPGLLRCAEEALTLAKRRHNRPLVVYDPLEMRAPKARAVGNRVFDIVDALNSRRITFATQAVVDAQSRELVFREALLRVRALDGQLITASEALPAVERSGLMPLIDLRMLELVADRLAARPDERLALNVSPLTIEGPEWLDSLAGHLGARPGIASRLIVELTETAAVRDPRATRARLDAMKALGVAIAIDDFGAGHTSFKHLRSFPVDILKIDGAFVQNLSRSSDDRYFVRALVDLAHHLGIATVAEWVENEETARLLADWGVDYLQGEHCGAPALAGGKQGTAPGRAAAG